MNYKSSSQNGLPEALRRRSRRDAQDGAKSTQRRAQKAPGEPQEAQEAASGGCGADLAAAWGPPGAQEASGGLREVILVILEAPGGCAHAKHAIDLS